VNIGSWHFASFFSLVTTIFLNRNNPKSFTLFLGFEPAEFHETISESVAYVFAAQDGPFGRLMTSAIWYEPPSP